MYCIRNLNYSFCNPCFIFKNVVCISRPWFSALRERTLTGIVFGNSMQSAARDVKFYGPWKDFLAQRRCQINQFDLRKIDFQKKSYC